MASGSTPSTNEPAKDLILVHTVQLKPMIKAQFQEEWYLVVLEKWFPLQGERAHS